jgi:sarcosine oxidase
MNVGVIGAGIAGSSAARFLSERGHRVTLFEQFPIGHAQGSSHGRSRIVRKAYPDAFYTDCMREAYPLWHDLQARTSLPILHECGLLYFGAEDDPEVVSMHEGLAMLEVPHEIMKQPPMMPFLRMMPNEIAIFSPEAGWVHAENALAATLALAEEAGTTVVEERIESLYEVEARFDAVVVCAGSWITRFVELDVTVTLETFGYVRGEGTIDAGKMPVWIESTPKHPYGFPLEGADQTLKIGLHQQGRPIDLDNADRTPDPDSLELIREFAGRRFGIDNPRIVESKGCLYTTTPDDDFRLGRIGEKSVFASACSGHGFKFGPWIGKLLADMVEGAPVEERFPRFAKR